MSLDEEYGVPDDTPRENRPDTPPEPGGPVPAGAPVPGNGDAAANDRATNDGVPTATPPAAAHGAPGGTPPADGGVPPQTRRAAGRGPAETHSAVAGDAAPAADDSASGGDGRSAGEGDPARASDTTAHDGDSAEDERAADKTSGGGAPGTDERVAVVDNPAVTVPSSGAVPAKKETAAAGLVPVAPPGRPRPGKDPTPDPVLDLEQRRREAGVDESAPFGRPGLPLGKAHPFVFGFIGALGVFTAWMLIQAITSARHVLVLIVVALFLAIGLNPAVEALQRARLPRSGAVAVVFAGVILVFSGFGFAIVPPLTHQITEFIDEVPTYIAQLQQNERIREFDQQHQVLRKVQDSVTNPDFGQTALDGVVGVGRRVVSGVFNVLSVLIMTLYFLISLPTIKTFFYRLAPRSRRARVALLGDEILVRIGGYVAGTITVATIAGTVAYAFMLVMEIPFALPLALFVGLTALIPLVGATIGAILVCTVAFFDGAATGIIAVIFFVVYQQVENYLIHPRVMKRAVDVQPAVTIIAALIGGALLGIIGALLAIPTAAAISLLVREVVVPRQETL